MTHRFTVRKVPSMLGAGGFEVVDSQIGDVSLPFTWEEDASHLARQWNTQHAAEQAEAHADEVHLLRAKGLL